MSNQDCQSVFALLSQYLDRELPVAECEELERHIRDCGPCVDFIDSLKKAVVLGREYRPEVEVPAITPPVRESLKAAYERMLAERAKAAGEDHSRT
jgi:predicted anti-sigma-YlaC factor YlaD